MPIRTVTFDADDTLWDFTGVAAEAYELVISRIRTDHPGVEVSVDDLVANHRRVVEASPPGRSFEAMRRQSMTVFARRHLGGDGAYGRELADLFFDHRHRATRLFDDVMPMLEGLGEGRVLGVITSGNTRWKETAIADRFAFWLAADQIGVRKPDPRVFHMAAAAAGCHIRELVHVGDEEVDVFGAKRAGARAVLVDRAGRAPGWPADAVVASLDELAGVLAEWDRAEEESVGVGPLPLPWPDDPRLDPELAARGDRRNVADRYRYWSREAIVADLDTRRFPFQVAVENWRHDLNIGTVVRTANAFAAAGVHIVGLRRWNRRGAMVTDRYQHLHHHDDVASLLEWASEHDLEVVGVDNLPDSEPLETAELPERCLFLFGQEGTGLSPAARAGASRVLSITQYGSTRSINAAVAAGIAMWSWLLRHG